MSHDIRSSDIENDWDIPHTHSSLLFDAFLALPEDPIVSGQHALHSHQLVDDGKRYGRDVSVNHIRGFGTLQEAIIPVDTETTNSTTGTVANAGVRSRKDGERSRKIAMLKTIHGSHDIGKPEGVQDVIGHMFGLL